ncbi:MAG TPA: alpha/beta fold hydrolase [Terrimesophilobacter sp.]|uniref:alpha/beta hydrolase family protein n=1 Tax=Terrimesophilobacter sp. TaxID=2906435 RepID=UPI002F959E12
MKVSRRHAVRPGRWIVAAGIVGAIAALATVAAGVLAVHVARMVVTPPRSREEDTDVLHVDEAAGTITFSRSPDAVVDGRYSFWFSHASGHARVGAILGETGSTVTRELLGVDFGDLASAASGRFNGWYYLYPDELGVAFGNVSIDTELGPAPAWLVPALDGAPRPANWVIQVHGRAVIRAETLRAVPVFRSAGYASLLVSYRNDGEAPDSGDGLYGLGDTEWRDVDAALSYAIDHGARSVILMGWSMGGATVLQALTRSPNASVVSGLVLDSPVIDWVTALDYQGKSMGLAKPIRSAAYALLGGAWGRVFTGQHAPIDLQRLDFVERARELTVPILILHSDDDDYVPSAASHALAAARPDIVTLEVFHTARHTKLWNFDPERWTRAIAGWLERRKVAEG